MDRADYRNGGSNAGSSPGRNNLSELEEKIVPNQGIWNSARNATLYGSLVLILKMITEPILSHTISNELANVFNMAGTMLALFFFIRFGGGAVVRHCALRASLLRARCIPWNYPAFLDYGTELLLLYKIGGG